MRTLAWPTVVRLAAAALVGGAFAGCAASGSLRAARAGNLAGLRAAIADERAKGSLSPSRARALARAVARADLETASGVDAERRVAVARGCADALDDELAARAERRDAAGAAAMLARIEAGHGRSASLADEFALADDAALRAVAARASWSARHAVARRRAFTDPDERVREGALRAAAEAADPDDRAGLLDAARLDPSPACRALSVRAAAAIGGADVVLALRDRWASADEAQRQAIVDAWAGRASWDAGGERELAKVLDGPEGTPRLAAAAAIVRRGGRDRPLATQVLVRGAAAGPARDRVLALASLPLDDAGARAALAAACDDRDGVVRIAALSRSLAGPPSDAARARENLVAATEAGSFDAAVALARAGEGAGRELLAGAVSGADERQALVAARALARLGDVSVAAPLLAADAPATRLAAVCALLDP